ncbi:L-aminoadipate-semialdehyde dehydrogenase-phosphopantetheinyl transferase isoform X2 [Anabas testudineus]|uniref:L-aminoadipate-semialdehyde dehydrogenase-phosphopantetheinyl transferase isoform X2 n=1 Tax=Anabas testudineus TaxID=64144 RepID=UPI000E45E3E7|nr:L-aminoadipate-semialdehyde dehydrogenase-phosphopantetheinyl transferase isoform X2 [Anabas testudineus]
MTGWDRAEDMGSVRWAFRFGSWTPSRSDWLFATRSVQREEKDRIGQFMFAKDAKSAMAGRLLLRRFVCERMGIPWSEIRLERSPRGKPYLPSTLKVSSDSDQTWSFNISHQGDYAVLAAEQGMQVGVDVMKITMPGSSSVPEFFRIMTRQFTANEWRVIQSAGSERRQLAAFYRHWESLLDADHHVAVALGPADKPGSSPLPSARPPPASFTLLSFSDLIASASPLTEEDPADWENFKLKAEAPQRQRETHTST